MRIVRFTVLAGILLLAIISDYRAWKIPNALIVFGWMSSICWNVGQHGLQSGAWHWLSGAVIPIITLWLFFLTHTIGSGDIKLFSVIGSFYGVCFFLWTFAAAILIAGIMSLFQLVREDILAVRLQYLANYLSNFTKERKLRVYYHRESDSEKPIIHLSGAIAGGYVIALVLM